MPSSKKALLLGLALLGNVLSFVAPTQALTVSPVKIELQGDPGQTLSADFRLLNEQDHDQTFYASAENFEAEGESGTPNFLPGDTDLASWISLSPLEDGSDPSVITLAAQEEVTRSFTVAIPEDAPAGGHFAALFWATSPSTEENSVAVGAKVGILVFLSVNGDFEQGGDLLSFDTTTGLHSFDQLPVAFSYRFQNSGADRIIPQGTLDLKNAFGWTSESIVVNSEQNNVLPTSVRKFEEQWGPDQTEDGFFATLKNQWEHFAVGPYTALLTLTYGPEDTVATSQIQIWVFPWQLLLVSLATLLLVFSLGTVFIRRYNRYIIAKALAVRKPIKRKK